MLNARIARVTRAEAPAAASRHGRRVSRGDAGLRGRHQRASSGRRDTIEATTIDDLRAGRDDDDADLYVTLANRRKEVEGLVRPGSHVVTVSFIPSERTRTRLAAVDPVARLGILSVFPEFLVLMKPGVLRFTPHVQSVEVALVDDPDLKAFLGRLDVVVYATGAEGALDGLPDGVEAIEYRHVPDPHAIQRELLPAIERRRAGLPLKETTA